MRWARGFTLIETLVALVVLSTGLLGAAALLLDSLRSHASALRTAAATSLVRDMADRIRLNPRGGAHYSSGNRAAETPACDESGGCDPAQLAAADLAHFASAARALFPHAEIEARVEYAPATGPATPARYLITLRWTDTRNAAGPQGAALQVLAQSPVAG
ncbi:MAG TPA: type IV pilus modification protein PilV [Steroidobacteraceae bacterium]|nr:type IV pilus modification protein PilV [Steroidobacteraceae bacterium]